MSEGLSRHRALREFGRRLGLRDSIRGDCALLEAALTHESYAFEHAAGDRARAISNERLEFLGDAVLGMIVSADLYARHPNYAEGKLSPRRAALVSRSALEAAAKRLQVGPLLRLGKGEARARGAERSSILAAAFEALVAAVFLSEGFEGAKKFVERALLAEVAHPLADPKTELQEFAQARFRLTPAYELTSQGGPPHARTFTASVAIGDKVVGSGSGPTKKQAQARAAAEALRRLGKLGL